MSIAQERPPEANASLDDGDAGEDPQAPLPASNDAADEPRQRRAARKAAAKPAIKMPKAPKPVVTVRDPPNKVHKALGKARKAVAKALKALGKAERALNKAHRALERSAPSTPQKTSRTVLPFGKSQSRTRKYDRAD
jgi:hypothetical protein